jgi:hypothetical protein
MKVLVIGGGIGGLATASAKVMPRASQSGMESNR